jgi:hypothetical protein
MGNKIQGEGDYEAAERFNRQQQDFVKRRRKRLGRQERAPQNGQANVGETSATEPDFGTEITRVSRHSSDANED